MMQYKNINEVPEVLKEFFSEDSEGNIVQATRPESICLAKLDEVIRLNSPIETITKFAELAADYSRWYFFDEYQDWLIKCKEIEQYNNQLTDENEGVSPLPLPDAPTKPESTTALELLEPYQIELFKRSRVAAIEEAKVTISTGKTFDANEISITRLGNAKLAAIAEPENYLIPWSTADVGTGVMVDCTKAEIVEAHQLAVLQMGELMSI